MSLVFESSKSLISDNIEITKIQHNLGANPSSVSFYKSKKTFQNDAKSTHNFIGNTIALSSPFKFKGIVLTQEETYEGILYTAYDYRYKLKKVQIFREINKRATNLPIGTIISETGILPDYVDPNNMLFFSRILNDINTILKSVGLNLDYSIKFIDQECPPMILSYTNALQYLVSICQTMGVTFYCEGTTIFLKQLNDINNSYKPDIDYLKASNLIEGSTESLTGITLYGEHELSEKSNTMILPDLNKELIKGNYYKTNYFKVNSNGLNSSLEFLEYEDEKTIKTELTTYSQLADLTITQILTERGWSSDTKISENAMIGLRIDDSELTQLLEYSNGTDTIITPQSEVGSLHNQLLSLPTLPLRTTVRSSFKWKTYEKLGTKYIKYPFLKTVKFLNQNYDKTGVSSASKKLKYVPATKLFNPEGKGVTVKQFILEDFFETGTQASNGDYKSDLGFDIKPAKIELDTGIIWFYIRDLLVIDSIDVINPPPYSGVDISYFAIDETKSKIKVNYQGDARIFNDNLIVKYKIATPEEITANYTLKRDRIKAVKGDGSFIKYVKGATKFPFFNITRVPSFEVLEGGRDDTPKLDKIATQMYENSSPKYNTYHLATIKDLSFSDGENIENISWEFFTETTLVKTSNQKPTDFINIMDMSFLQISTIKNKWQKNFLKTFYDYNGGGYAPDSKLERTSELIELVLNTQTPIEINPKSNPQTRNIGGEQGALTVQSDTTFSKGVQGQTEKRDVADIDIKNSMKIDSVISGQLNSGDTGVILADTTPQIPKHFSIAKDDDNKNPYILVGIHQHLEEGLIAPKKDEGDWEQKGDISGVPLLAPGTFTQFWNNQNNRKNLPDNFTISTNMSNITKFQKKDINGKFVDDTFFDNNGNYVNINAEPKKVKEAPVMFAYMETTNFKGYFPMMCP